MEKLYTVKTKARLGADCAKFRLKLKKAGKTIRPLRYEVNQIAYNYTVQVRNRLKGLDLIDRVPEEVWTEIVTLYRRQRSRPSPRKRKNAKWLSEEALQIVVKIREAKGKGEKERYTHCNVEFQRIARRD